MTIRVAKRKAIDMAIVVNVMSSVLSPLASGVALTEMVAVLPARICIVKINNKKVSLLSAVPYFQKFSA